MLLVCQVTTSCPCLLMEQEGVLVGVVSISGGCVRCVISLSRDHMLPLFINGARGGVLLVYQESVLFVYQEGVLGVLLVYQETTCCPCLLMEQEGASC